MGRPKCEAKRLVVAFDLVHEKAKVLSDGNYIRIAMIEGISNKTSELVIRPNDLNAKIDEACDHPDVFCTSMLRQCGFVYNAKVP